MDKRDNTIRGLEYLAKWLHGKFEQTGEGDYELDAQTAENALALLKEQEPVEPVRKPEIFDSLYFCGKCLTKVGFQIRKDDSWRFKCNFCPNCGMAVKWDD